MHERRREFEGSGHTSDQDVMSKPLEKPQFVQTRRLERHFLGCARSRQIGELEAPQAKQRSLPKPKGRRVEYLLAIETVLKAYSQTELDILYKKEQRYGVLIETSYLRRLR